LLKSWACRPGDDMRGCKVKSKHARKRLKLPVLPAVMIASGVSSAHALELGTINVHSSLGQPLRASIAYALAPNEAIDEYCVSLVSANRQVGLPGLSRAHVQVSNGLITITGRTAITDPLLTATLEVRCPYTPKVTREFMLFVDPAGVDSETMLVTAPAPGSRVPEPTPRLAAETLTAIATGSTYRVRPGDSLSGIVRRLQGPKREMWTAVNAIFALNPDAFMNADPNQLKAGALLRIPQNLGGREFAGLPDTAVQTAAAQTAAPAAMRNAPVQETAVAVAPLVPVALDDIAASDVEVVGEVETIAAAYDLLDSDGFTAADAHVTPVAEPPAAIERIDAASRKPAVVAETMYDADYASGSGSAWWTLGVTLAAIAGLLFRRRRSQRDQEDAVAAAMARVERPPRHLDEPSIEVEIIGMPQDSEDVEYELSDDSPTAENLALDANLVDGNGLYTQSSTGNIDFELGEDPVLDLDLSEAAPGEPEECETNIIPPPNRCAGSILESEVLPEEHDYELSVVVDVTKMPVPEEATERDLKAVVVDDASGSSLITEIDGYTLSKEVDYQILEQDYEDELTATQALNLEIERAAQELTRELDGELTIDTEMLPREETMAVPVADISELDLTAALSADNDDMSLEKDTDDTAEITARFDAGAA
jgi:hypothetical protein